MNRRGFLAALAGATAGLAAMAAPGRTAAGEDEFGAIAGEIGILVEDVSRRHRTATEAYVRGAGCLMEIGTGEIRFAG